MAPFRQELLQQALAVQALQFLQPQARAGRYPGRQGRPQAARFLLSRESGTAAVLACGDDTHMAKWRDNEAPVRTVTRFSTSRPIRGFVAIFALRHPHAAARSS